ncbi:MAG TPA: hypothetical protein VEG64_09185 [Candidatus Sulfotelmatobacter sp.]|nr:hypothetical protein [Candidatus Sulfotelmatobacter sp.]
MNDAIERFEAVATDCLMEQKARLTARRAELVRADIDAETLCELDAAIADLHAAVNLLVVNRMKREQERERFAKWKAILPTCREALDRVEQLGRDFERQNSIAMAARSALDFCDQRIAQHREAKPNPRRYPTDAELKKHADGEAELEAIRERARVKVKEAVELQHRLAYDHVKAREDFARLEFSERQLRPKSAPPPDLYFVGAATVGHLSGVG